MKRTLSLILISVLLLFSLAACASDAPGIKDMPYPHAPEGMQEQFSFDLDYAGTNSVQSLWDDSKWVVVGYYKDVPPVSCNINRRLDDPSQEADNFYMEALIYQFHVVSVLKGDGIEADTDIPLGQLHGMKEGNYSFPYETFCQPDAQSYKIMFLDFAQYPDHYYPWYMDMWLSSEPQARPLSSLDWTQLDFLLESALPIESDDPYGYIIHYDLALPTGGVMTASDTPRDSYTGAELLAYADAS